MSIEHDSRVGIKVATKDQVVETILENVPDFKEEYLDKPVGVDQTTLNQFLNNKKEDSEWTDPRGFKINIVNGEFKLSF